LREKHDEVKKKPNHNHTPNELGQRGEKKKQVPKKKKHKKLGVEPTTGTWGGKESKNKS